MTFYDKLKWVLGILMVFGLIITTNLIDRNNFVRVRDSVQTIYEDRLIANDLIFGMLKAVHQKELATSVWDTTFFQAENTKVNDKLQSLFSRFEETKLTKEETRIFQNLKQNVQALTRSEGQIVSTDPISKTQLLSQIENVKSNLDALAEIQLNEGSRQMLIGKRAVNKIELFTQIEIYLLIFLALVIQIIVMYNPKTKS